AARLPVIGNDATALNELRMGDAAAVTPAPGDTVAAGDSFGGAVGHALAGDEDVGTARIDPGNSAVAQVCAGSRVPARLGHEAPACRAVRPCHLPADAQRRNEVGFVSAESPGCQHGVKAGIAN